MKQSSWSHNSDLAEQFRAEMAFKVTTDGYFLLFKNWNNLLRYLIYD